MHDEICQKQLSIYIDNTILTFLDDDIYSKKEEYIKNLERFPEPVSISETGKKRVEAAPIVNMHKHGALCKKRE